MSEWVELYPPSKPNNFYLTIKCRKGKFEVVMPKGVAARFWDEVPTSCGVRIHFGKSILSLESHGKFKIGQRTDEFVIRGLAEALATFYQLRQQKLMSLEDMARTFLVELPDRGDGDVDGDRKPKTIARTADGDRHPEPEPVNDPKPVEGTAPVCEPEPPPGKSIETEAAENSSADDRRSDFVKSLPIGQWVKVKTQYIGPSGAVARKGMVGMVVRHERNYVMIEWLSGGVMGVTPGAVLELIDKAPYGFGQQELAEVEA